MSLWDMIGIVSPSICLSPLLYGSDLTRVLPGSGLAGGHLGNIVFNTFLQCCLSQLSTVQMGFGQLSDELHNRDHVDLLDLGEGLIAGQHHRRFHTQFAVGAAVRLAVG